MGKPSRLTAACIPWRALYLAFLADFGLLAYRQLLLLDGKVQQVGLNFEVMSVSDRTVIWRR